MKILKTITSTVVLIALLGLMLPSAVAGAEKEWTFMVFINADNNLDENGVLDMEEMARTGSNEHLNIVVLIDRYQAPATLNYIEKGRIVKLADEGELDLGDWHELVRFAKTAMSRFPARKYALTVWNHGSGWKFRGEGLKGISYDDSSNNHITTAQLGEALREISAAAGRKIDLFCMDACLMQMLEVAWVLRESCAYLVASEETVPADGYPYTEILQALKPGMGPIELGTIIVSEFRKCYNKDVPQEGPWELMPRSRSRVVKRTTMSLLDVARLPDLKERLDAFCRVIMAGNFAKVLNEACRESETFAYGEHVDVKDLLDCLKGKVKDPALLAAMASLQESFRAAVLANGTTGTTENGQEPGGDDSDDLRPVGRRGGAPNRWPVPICANGLAIYFPAKATNYLPAYDELELSAAGLWNDLLVDHFRKLTAAQVAADLEHGSFETAREALQQAKQRPLHQAIARAFVEALTFGSRSEKKLPASLVDEARVLIKAFTIP